MAKTETTAANPAVKEIAILGALVQVAQPYVEGQTINAAEAKALNQTRAENISNNCRKFVKDAQNEDGSYSDEALVKIREHIAEKDASYEFTLAAIGGRKITDPLEKECHALARARITAALKAKGKLIKDVDKDALAAKIVEVAENPQIIALAKQRLKERENLAEAIDVEL